MDITDRNAHRHSNLIIAPTQNNDPVKVGDLRPPSTPEKAREDKIAGVQLSAKYNALLTGLTLQESGESQLGYRARLYTNLGLETDGAHLRFSGMNEIGSHYIFGRNVLTAGGANHGTEIVAAARHFGNRQVPTTLLDLGVGIRFNVGDLKIVDYGFVDIVKNIGAGPGNSKSAEVVTFLGKNLGPLSIESTSVAKQGADFYIEAELKLNIQKEVKHVEIDPYIRSELSGGKRNTFSMGAQLKLPVRSPK